MDQILIRGLEIYAYHGVNPEEKEHGQPFAVDATASVDLSVPGKTDDVMDTVSYAKLIKTIRRVMLSEKNDLLERVSQRICEAVFAEYPAVMQLDITLKKPEAPIAARFGYVGVSISRRRGE